MQQFVGLYDDEMSGERRKSHAFMPRQRVSAKRDKDRAEGERRERASARATAIIYSGNVIE